MSRQPQNPNTNNITTAQLAQVRAHLNYQQIQANNYLIDDFFNLPQQPQNPTDQARNANQVRLSRVNAIQQQIDQIDQQQETAFAEENRQNELEARQTQFVELQLAQQPQQQPNQRVNIQQQGHRVRVQVQARVQARPVKSKNTMISQALKDHLKAAQQIKEPERHCYEYVDSKQIIDCVICPYCNDVYFNPMRLQCGDTFCQICLEKFKYDGTCYCCKKPIDWDLVGKDMSLMHYLEDMVVYCKNKSEGCMWTDKIKEFQIHEKNCKFVKGNFCKQPNLQKEDCVNNNYKKRRTDLNNLDCNASESNLKESHKKHIKKNR